jgi:hypothetical protein
MSNVVEFPRRERPILTCLDGGRDGRFILCTDADGHPLDAALGPFRDMAAAREFALDVAKQNDIIIDWKSFGFDSPKGAA